MKCGHFTETQTSLLLTAPGAEGGNLGIWGFQMMFGKKRGLEELGGGGLSGGLCEPIPEVACILSAHILAVKNKILLDTRLSGCSLGRFVRSRVGVCGLEVLGRISRENKRTTDIG